MANQAGWGGSEPKKKRARSLGVDAVGEGSSVHATSPASESCAHPESAAAALVDVTVEDPDALDCVVCFLPLKPPIFQCDVGHVVCSLCRDKLQATGKCHVCGVITSIYRRCHAMERLVESIHVPCLYAAHGCALRPAYYDQERHRLVCGHAPCHCPGEACSFVGSMAALLSHFSTAHGWPCMTTVKADGDGFFTVDLRDGFNLLLVDLSMENKNQGATASIQCLLLLSVARQQLVRSISVHCIDPHAGAASGCQGLTSKEMQCELRYSEFSDYMHTKRSLIGNNQLFSGKNQLFRHVRYQESRFRVVRTDLANGLPEPDDCFQFVVPNSVITDHDKFGIRVKVHIVIK